jgi:hypothetical protein
MLSSNIVGTDNKKVALFTFPEVKFFSVPCNAILNKVNIERIFTSTVICFKREILRFFLRMAAVLKIPESIRSGGVIICLYFFVSEVLSLILIAIAADFLFKI